MPDIEHDESLVEYPEPDTWTVRPTEPKFGLRARVGTVNVVLVLDVKVVLVKLVDVDVIVSVLVVLLT